MNSILKELQEYKILSTRVRNVERALETLDPVEREIIQLKYLAKQKYTDIFIYLEMGLAKDSYYEKKKSALSKLARVLGIG